MNTEDYAEGGGSGEAVNATPSAPPAYPVLNQPGGQPQQQQPQQVIYANSQQPQQVIYQQQPDESKQLELEIGNKFNSLSQSLDNKKQSILNSLNNANNAQKKDILNQLNNLQNAVNAIMINQNVQQQPPQQQQQQQQQVQPQIIYAQPPPQQAQQPVIIQQVQPNIKVVNDTWQILNTEIVLNQQMNSVYRNGKGSWLSTFGQQVINKGQYKKWDIRIIPKFVVRNAKQGIADMVIGICDANLVKQIGAKRGSFWLSPFYGYGFYGFNGKKFHNKKKGSNYAKKFNVNDTISVELNMQSYSLNFYTNGINNGKAFGLDATRTYVLAVAFLNADYEAQIM